MAEVEAAAINQAVDAASAALVRAQDVHGRWLDFPELGSGSNEWVTGYIGAALVGSSTVEARAAASRAWKSLAAQRRWSGGWGFMPSYPADSDSTACVLRLAQSLPLVHRMRTWRARHFLGLHQRLDGGIATYVWPRFMAFHTKLPESFAGWCGSHVCVSANAAAVIGLKGRRRILAYLRSQQLSDGSWRAYWWHDEREYATALAASAFAQAGDCADVSVLQRAVQWACDDCRHRPIPVNSAAPDGSPFAAALRLRVLFLGNRQDAAALCEESLSWLLARQRNDGTWASAAWLRFPPTEVVDTTTITDWQVGKLIRAGVMSDSRGLFTTATVLTALHAAQSTSWWP